MLEHAIAENRGDLPAANLLGVPALIRSGGADGNVPVWHSRRYARLLREVGVDTVYDEVPGKEHWWWDTKHSNDGGVVFDKTMRAFFTKHLAPRPDPSPTHDAFDVVSLNPRSVLLLFCFRLLVEQCAGVRTLQFDSATAQVAPLMLPRWCAAH